MANFAQLGDNNEVLSVIVIDNADILDEFGNESEKKGIRLCKALTGHERWAQTSYNGTFRHQFAEVGMVYDEEYDAFLPPKPKPWYIFDGKSWVVPFPINCHTGEPLSHDELAYILYYIRHTKAYRLCPAVLKNPADAFTANACISGSYMYPTFDALITGENKVAQAIPHKIVDDTLQIPLPLSLVKYLDLSPIGLVVHGKFEVFTEYVIPLFNTHPQSSGRTPHELFRLIIEWAWAYTDLGNREFVAETCHNFLRALQMPLEVRQALLTEVPAQAVELYIRGEHPFAATDSIFVDPESPQVFTEWLDTIIDEHKMRVLESDEVLDLSILPEDYPR